METVEVPPDHSLQLTKEQNGRTMLRYKDNVPSDAPADGTLVELGYYVQDKRMRKAPLAARFMHVVFSVRLLPSRSIRFGVPRDDFKKGYNISVPFNYDFELNKNGLMPGLETNVFHNVYFFNDHLPNVDSQQIKR
jgi:hypothetical protein